MIDRRKFLTGVAAGVATAIAGAGKPDLYYFGTPEIKRLRSFVSVDIALNPDRVVATGRQMGKTKFVREYLTNFMLNNPGATIHWAGGVTPPEPVESAVQYIDMITHDAGENWFATSVESLD